jgi:nucleoside-diphosphate-sugar epimerase
MVECLCQRGHGVTGLDTDYYHDANLFDPPADYPCKKKDIRDTSVEDLRGFDAIIHLAALSNDPLGELRPAWTFEINHAATVRLAERAKQAGVRRFLYASSCSMYGAAGDEILKEDAPLRPVTPYAVSKLRAEEDLAKLADQQFSPTFLRNATVYGVSSRLRVDLVLNNLVGWAVTSGKIRILSDGTPWRPIVHVRDLAQAFLCVLEAPVELIHNQAFNVGHTDENYQVRDLAAIVEKVAPTCSVEYGGKSGPDPRNYRVDFGKLARTFPHFRPNWNAAKGAQELYDAYRGVGMTMEQFQGRKFTRLKQLQHLLQSGYLDDTLRWVAAPGSGLI